MGSEVEASLRDSIASHADVWQRGCVGEDLTTTERTVFYNLVMAYTYRYFQRWAASRSLVSAGGESTFVDGVALNVRDYPGFRDAWKKIDWDPPFRDVVNARVAELGAQADAADPAACGI